MKDIEKSKIALILFSKFSKKNIQKILQQDKNLIEEEKIIFLKILSKFKKNNKIRISVIASKIIWEVFIYYFKKDKRTRVRVTKPFIKKIARDIEIQTKISKHDSLVFVGKIFEKLVQDILVDIL